MLQPYRIDLTEIVQKLEDKVMNLYLTKQSPGYIISTIFFVSGLVTLLQVIPLLNIVILILPEHNQEKHDDNYCRKYLFDDQNYQSSLGVRLPIIQGGTFSFLVPTIAILRWSSCSP